MSISEPFIRRPVATSLLMAGVVLLGILGYKLLPISALPTVDFPTIEVTTFYPGASADVMVSSITTPLERQFGQISGLASMNSTSSFGTSTITLQFVLDRPIDVAAQDVQAATNVAGGFLPPNLPNPPKYNKVNPAYTPILTLSITSDSLPLDRVNDFADTLLAQKISEVTGVGLVTIQGNQKPAVRVQVNPAAISALGLSLEAIDLLLRVREHEPTVLLLEEERVFPGVLRVPLLDHLLEGGLVLRLGQRDRVRSVVREVEPDEVDLVAESRLHVLLVVEARLLLEGRAQRRERLGADRELPEELVDLLPLVGVQVGVDRDEDRREAAAPRSRRGARAHAR